MTFINRHRVNRNIITLCRVTYFAIKNIIIITLFKDMIVDIQVNVNVTTSLCKQNNTRKHNFKEIYSVRLHLKEK